MGETENLLIHIAENGGMYSDIEISTILIAKSLSVSQQTVSRKLIELEKTGLINRNASTRGIRISLTDDGRENLMNLQVKLSNILSKKTLKLKGIVESGVGEGSYYISLKPYLVQFKKILNIDPFRGTLNLHVEYSDFAKFVASLEKFRIDGFQTSSRSFGPITAFKVKLNNIYSAILIPDRTSHDKSVIEVISKVCFRKKFSLKDGEEVILTQ